MVNDIVLITDSVKNANTVLVLLEMSSGLKANLSKTHFALKNGISAGEALLLEISR